MNDRIKLALWKNDKRQTQKHPMLSAGKPVEIDGKQYWLSGYINAGQGDQKLQEGVERMIEALANSAGTYPIVSLTLTPAEPQANAPQTASDPAPEFSDDILF